MATVSVRDLLDAGMHYGHHVSRWNPKMAPYIFGKRNAIHIIDLRQTVKGLITACKFVTHVVSQGKTVVFVGTKRQARNAIKEQATRCGMPYVIERWLGGTLTNFRTIRSRLDRLTELEGIVEGPGIEQYSKKEGARMKRELEKIKRNLDGIRNMDHIPGAVIIIDPKREKNAVAEAKRLNLPTVCLADTDCDPDWADVLIPGNDCSIRSVTLVAERLADAVNTGKEKRRELARIEAEKAAAEAAERAKAKKEAAQQKAAEAAKAKEAQAAREAQKAEKKPEEASAPAEQPEPAKAQADAEQTESPAANRETDKQ